NSTAYVRIRPGCAMLRGKLRRDCARSVSNQSPSILGSEPVDRSPIGAQEHQRDRPRLTGAHGLAVDAGDGNHFTSAAREKHFFRMSNFGHLEETLDDFQADLACEIQNDSTCDALDDAGIMPRREECAIADHIDVACDSIRQL